MFFRLYFVLTKLMNTGLPIEFTGVMYIVVYNNISIGNLHIKADRTYMMPEGTQQAMLELVIKTI